MSASKVKPSTLSPSAIPVSLTPGQRFVKRCFDVCVTLILLPIALPLIAVGWVAAKFSSGASGFFVQRRVGKDGALFSLIKLRTMRVIPELSTCVTAENDARITRVGGLLRALKIDELPQLFNVLAGHMSLVGPRPDVPGFADELTGEDRIVLSIRPGVTGPASLKFRNEEQLLAETPDPEKHNRDVIWPEKVRINVDYIKNYSLMADVKCILWTVFPRKNA